jgi:hypothetical protein
VAFLGLILARKAGVGPERRQRKGPKKERKGEMQAAQHTTNQQKKAMKGDR